MEIIKIQPQGFCKGVIQAMKLINHHLEANIYPRPFYMLGGLVHNKHIIAAYQKAGIFIISSLDNITEGSIIITAHGGMKAIKEEIKKRGLSLIDATCPEVTKTHVLIEEKLQVGYQVIFYGKKDHPETKGVLGISTQIILIENINEAIALHSLEGKVAFLMQTTMSHLDLNEILSILKAKIPTLETFHDLCSATRMRQEALINGLIGVDLVIIVGDPMSNNTKKLYEIATLNATCPVLLSEKIDDLLNYDFSKIAKVAITAGASTPPAIVEEIIEGLKNGLHPSRLSAKDYLRYQKTR